MGGEVSSPTTFGVPPMPNLPAHQCPVAAIPAAPSDEAAAHFAKLLAFETDCWDVLAGLQRNPAAFVLLDVRSPELYARGHVPLAKNLPHGKITEHNLQEYPP